MARTATNPLQPLRRANPALPLYRLYCTAFPQTLVAWLTGSTLLPFPHSCCSPLHFRLRCSCTSSFPTNPLYFMHPNTNEPNPPNSPSVHSVFFPLQTGWRPPTLPIFVFRSHMISSDVHPAPGRHTNSAVVVTRSCTGGWRSTHTFDDARWWAASAPLPLTHCPTNRRLHSTDSAAPVTPTDHTNASARPSPAAMRFVAGGDASSLLGGPAQPTSSGSGVARSATPIARLLLPFANIGLAAAAAAVPPPVKERATGTLFNGEVDYCAGQRGCPVITGAG